MPSFPPTNASPGQIRDYLVQILTLKHDTTNTFARDTAGLWQLGRGIDFHQATLHSTDEMFTRIFGDAVGPFLYQSAREDCIAQWRASTAGTINFWALIGFPILGLLLLIRAWRRSPQHDKLLALGDACWSFGPPLMVCGFIECEYSILISALAMTLGLWSTMAAIVSLLSKPSNASRTPNEKITEKRSL